MRTADFRRAILNPAYHAFIATDVKTGRDVAFSGFLAPMGPNYKHLQRTQTLYDRTLALLFKIYDFFASGVLTWSVQAHLFYPTLGAGVFERRELAGVEGDGFVRRFLAKQDEARGFWCLAVIGTLPQYSGHGIAPRLMEWGLQAADEQDQAVYVWDASEGGARLYLKHGFEVVGETTMFEGEPLGGFIETTMCRPPLAQRALASKQK